MTNIWVTVQQATNLEDDDGPFNGSDPYVYIELEGCEPRRTSTVGQEPVWNEDLIFEGVTSPASKEMLITIYDDDWGKDDKIGHFKLDLGKLKMTEDLQDFDVVVDHGWFSNATLQFQVKTDGSWGNPDGAGDLKVYVKSCTGLDDADFTGTTDPYCVVTIEGCESQQTAKKDGTINPEWEEEFTFQVEEPLSKTVKFTIYDEDTWSRDDKIGECEVDLAELVMNGESKDYEMGVDFALFGLIKQATLAFKLEWEGWGNLAE